MINILKILKFIVILIITVTILLFSASLILQDTVAKIVLTSLSRNLSTKLEVGSVRLSFLRKFPKASLELSDVLVRSSPDFVKTAFKGINTDTLLSARNVSVEFKITDIIRGNYNIESIGAKNGKINFYTDNAGFINYNISVKTPDSGNPELTINLERINLTDIKAYYNNLATKLIINGKVTSGKLKSRISGHNIDFMADAEMEVYSFQLFNTIITKTINAGLELSLLSTDAGIQFKKGTLSIEDFEFGLDGFISAENVLDLNVTGKDVNLAKIRKYLPEKYLAMAEGYNPSGLLGVICKIDGLMTRTKNPHVEISTTLNNGKVTFGKSDLVLSNLSFAGNYSNGAQNNLKTSSVSLKNLKVRLGSSDYTGALNISGFTQPVTDLVLNGRVFPGELKEFFDIKSITLAEGSVDVDIQLTTNFWPKDSLTVNDLLVLKPDAKLGFNSFSFGLQNNRLVVNNVTGEVLISDYVTTNNLSLNYKGQNIKVDGEFRYLPEWLLGKPVRMSATADISFNRFNPEAFMKTISEADKSSARKSSAFSLPGDLLLDINFKIDSLVYKTFRSSDITGTINYKPRILTFKSLKMNALGGSFSGTGFIVQNISKSVIGRGSFDLTSINVNETFKTFNNFGQTFIKAENLAGSLSGSLSILLPMDSLLKPDIKSVTAEGKYILTSGGLINFEPVKELSDFIELSELENINFEKLQNDFFIRNNFLYIPQMDIKSSAADLSINGKHSFDNNYEYHIKMLLSEILSKKRKRTRSSVTEFGAIQDDGLGRTSILLKVEGKGEVVKVGYDLKAASAGVKSNIKSERQTLKSILNQEYGWYKTDTTIKEKPVEKKPRFKISWDDGDSTKSVVTKPAVKKESVVKGILKKK
jgi:hypothetical protein